MTGQNGNDAPENIILCGTLFINYRHDLRNCLLATGKLTSQREEQKFKMVLKSIKLHVFHKYLQK